MEKQVFMTEVATNFLREESDNGRCSCQLTIFESDREGVADSLFLGDSSGSEMARFRVFEFNGILVSVDPEILERYGNIHILWNGEGTQIFTENKPE